MSHLIKRSAWTSTLLLLLLFMNSSCKQSQNLSGQTAHDELARKMAHDLTEAEAKADLKINLASSHFQNDDDASILLRLNNEAYSLNEKKLRKNGLVIGTANYIAKSETAKGGLETGLYRLEIWIIEDDVIIQYFTIIEDILKAKEPVFPAFALPDRPECSIPLCSSTFHQQWIASKKALANQECRELTYCVPCLGQPGPPCSPDWRLYIFKPTSKKCLTALPVHNPINQLCARIFGGSILP